ncbi:MAG: ABC transporter permease, partial [Rhodoglobus sp.]
LLCHLQPAAAQVMTSLPAPLDPLQTTAPQAPYTAGPTRRFLRRFFHQPLAVVATTIFVILVLSSIFAPLIATYSPTALDLSAVNKPPSSAHWFGTDDLGRDLFSRMVFGARITLVAPFIAVTVGVLLGVPIGMVAGFRGGVIDALASRVSDALQALPAIIVALAILAARGSSTFNAMVAVGLAFAPRLFRIARATTMSVRHEIFIDASRVAGASDGRLVFSHVLPNIAPALIVQSTILLGVGVLAEAALSFLGIGVQPPTATWGVLLRRGFDNLHVSSIQSTIPGVAITLLILSFQFIGQGLSDSLGKEIRRG